MVYERTNLLTWAALGLMACQFEILSEADLVGVQLGHHGARHLTYFVTYGTAGTSSLGGNPSIGNVGTPVIGNSFDVTLTDGIPFSFAILFLGFSDTVWNRPPVINLPYDLVAIGAPGNTLYAAGDFRLIPALLGSLLPMNYNMWMGNPLPDEGGSSFEENSEFQ